MIYNEFDDLALARAAGVYIEPEDQLIPRDIEHCSWAQPFAQLPWQEWERFYGSGFIGLEHDLWCVPGDFIGYCECGRPADCACDTWTY